MPATTGARAAGKLPRDIIPMVERYARYSMELPNEPGDDGMEIYRDIVAPLYTLAQADPDGFSAALRDRVLLVGDWAVLGASRIMWEVLTNDQQPPARAELLSAALQVLRHRGVPSLYVKGYEWDHWLRIRDQNEPWLTGRPRPTPQEAPITDLAEGELRRIAQVFPAEDSNVILVRRHADGGYVSVIDARWSEDDPRRVQNEDKRADTLNELYWQIGCAFQIPTHWFHPEMEKYFPLPRPRLN